MPTAGIILVIDTKKHKVYISYSIKMKTRISRHKTDVKNHKNTLGKSIESVADMTFEKYKVSTSSATELQFHKQSLLNILDKRLKINKYDAMESEKYERIKESGSYCEDEVMKKWFANKLEDHEVE